MPPVRRSQSEEVDEPGPTAEECEAAFARERQSLRRAPRPGQAPPVRHWAPAAPHQDAHDGGGEDGADGGGGGYDADPTGDAFGGAATGGAATSGITNTERNSRRHAADEQRHPQAIADQRLHMVEQQPADQQLDDALLQAKFEVRTKCALARHACCRTSGSSMDVAVNMPRGMMCWDDAARTYRWTPGPPAAAPAPAGDPLAGEGSSHSTSSDDSGDDSSGLCPPGLELVRCRSVIYMRFTDFAEVPVPTVKCAHCAHSWELQPEEVGCAPSSPGMARMWLDVQCAEFYSQLAHTDGTSCSAYSKALARARRLAAGLDPCTPVPLANDE